MKTNTLTSEYKGKQRSSVFLNKKHLADTRTYEKTQYPIQYHKANLQPLWASVGPGWGQGVWVNGGEG